MTLRDAAIDYVRAGWVVTPIRPADKRPMFNAWPTVSRRISEANADTIWTMYPEANIGLLTGIGFDVLDIDGPEGKASLGRYLTSNRYRPTGPVVSTGGGGLHLYFQPTGEGNRAQMLTKVDYRGIGGQVIAPPSIHPNGTVYRWLAGHGPETRLPEAPDWLLALLRQTAALERVVRDPSRILERGDVVAAFIEKGDTPRRDGPNRYKVRCYTGLHSDTEPSLTIYTATNSWYCHGCLSSGDAGNVKDGSYVRQGRRATVS
jgi:Bifunctional DNA primase/polymerase, N-terminal